MNHRTPKEKSLPLGLLREAFAHAHGLTGFDRDEPFGVAEPRRNTKFITKLWYFVTNPVAKAFVNPIA
jgi:hypothetical protein